MKLANLSVALLSIYSIKPVDTPALKNNTSPENSAETPLNKVVAESSKTLLETSGDAILLFSKKSPPAQQEKKSLSLPETPQSNRYAKYDYRKGDHAKTLDQFKQSVQNEYKITSNANGKSDELLNKNPIIVYGEIHSQPLVPSFRGEKGLLLLESKDPEKCLPKHKMHASNTCVYIDKAAKNSEQATINSLHNCINKATTLLELIKPGQMKLIEESVRKTSGQTTAIIQYAFQFSETQFPLVFTTANKIQQEKLIAAKNNFQESLNELNQLITSNFGNRENTMLEESIQAISKSGEDHSAIAVVGAIHAKHLAKGLAKQFPERAVILAIPVNLPAGINLN